MEDNKSAWNEGLQRETKTRNKHLVFIYIMMGLFILASTILAGYSVYLTIRMNGLTATAAQIEANYQSLKQEKQDQNRFATADDVAALKQKLDQIASDVDSAYSLSLYAWIADDLQFSGVSKYFVTDSILFSSNNEVFLNLAPQNSFKSKYLGNGKFDVSDADLKQMLAESVQYLFESYDKARLPTMVPTSELKVLVMVNAIDIATYQNGNLVLAD